MTPPQFVRSQLVKTHWIIEAKITWSSQHKRTDFAEIKAIACRGPGLKALGWQPHPGRVKVCKMTSPRLLTQEDPAHLECGLYDEHTQKAGITASKFSCSQTGPASSETRGSLSV